MTSAFFLQQQVDVLRSENRKLLKRLAETTALLEEWGREMERQAAHQSPETVQNAQAAVESTEPSTAGPL
jgi:hypothetical protein